MFMKRVATVAVAAGFTVGLNSAPASAEAFQPGCVSRVRNDQWVMKPCAAADRAAYWRIDSRIDSRMGHIKNNLTNKCLARMANDRVNTAACTGGDSQLWYPNF
ncbi:hypothetical protein ACFZAV_39150 [Streptomyces sp. NPDC008343]|uniref:hypothetical protein n=1 Tax=Streptomyces sp. NPDC008343 TaxID=3364828 RepID=UPI0036EA1403